MVLLFYGELIQHFPVHIHDLYFQFFRIGSRFQDSSVGIDDNRKWRLSRCLLMDETVEVAAQHHVRLGIA